MPARPPRPGRCDVLADLLGDRREGHRRVDVEPIGAQAGGREPHPRARWPRRRRGRPWPRRRPGCAGRPPRARSRPARGRRAACGAAADGGRGREWPPGRPGPEPSESTSDDEAEGEHGEGRADPEEEVLHPASVLSLRGPAARVPFPVTAPCGEVEERTEDAQRTGGDHGGCEADPVGHQAEQRPGDAEGEERHHRVDRQHGGAVLRLRLAVQQRGVGRAVQAVHRVGEQVGRDEPDRPGDQAHDDRAQGVEHPAERWRPARRRVGPSVVPASQAPTLNRPHPAAETGPTRAPASCAEPTISSSRSGMNDSKVIMPIDQKTSATTMPMSSTRLRPQQAAGRS